MLITGLSAREPLDSGPVNAFQEEGVSGHGEAFQVGQVCELNEMLAEYYEKRGWVNGVVPESKLKELEII